ncbi:MAG TPA: hypothetical protein VGB45_11680 [Abditibacterium sp.]
MAIWVYAGHINRPFREPVESGYAGVTNFWLNAWTTFDSYWYLRIAKIGFEPLSAGFFPFYSLLLRLAGPGETATAAWGVALSNLGFAVGLGFLFLLTKLDWGEKIAFRAVFLTTFFPISAVFSAVYTEGVYFALLTGAFWFFRQKKWFSAAIFGFLVALTRNAGPIISAALCLEAFRLPKSERKQALLVALMPILGFLAVQTFLYFQFQGLGATKTQELYGRSLGWPYLPIWRDLSNVFAGRALEITTILNLAATLAAIYFLVRGLRSERISSSVLLGGIMLAQLCLGRTSAPYTNSSLRFLMTTFPFAQHLARASEKLTANRLRTAICVSAYLLACALMSYLFGQKQFVTG